MRDVNNTGFKLVLGRSDWQDQFGVDAARSGNGGSADPPVVYDAERRSVSLPARTDRFPRSVSASELGPGDRSTAARDRYGSWYWIDPTDDQRIVVRNAGDGVVETFWSPALQAEQETGAPDAPGTFRSASDSSTETEISYDALTITTDHRLVVASSSPAQLLVFDLHAGGPPQRIVWEGPAPFQPVDATPRPDGGLYLLDRPDSEEASEAASGEAPRLWALDRTFRSERRVQAPDGSVFEPVDSSAENDGDTNAETRARTAPRPSGTLAAAPAPQAVEALPDDSVLVLVVGEESRTDRYRLQEDGTLTGAGTMNLTEELKPADQDSDDAESSDAESSDAESEGPSWSDTWEAHDVAFVPGMPDVTESIRGTLYVVGRDGDQAYALHLSGNTDDATARAKPEYIPLHRFSGKGIVETGGDVYYDTGERWTDLACQPRPRFGDHGRVQSVPLDSEIADCTWHRVFLDAHIPTEADVRLEARASDRADWLSQQPWREQPSFYRRDGGSEVPYHNPFPGGDRDGEGTWEVLLQGVEGRYLQLRLTLKGNGRTTPRIQALRAYYPRFSYLDEYMPDVYQDDEASAAFVERFLAITEGTLTDLEGRIAAVQSLFDVRTVPDEYLDWLATWFGASFDPAFDARRKRLFLDHAVELFSQRGTMAGLARMLTLVLDPCADESLFTPAGIAGAVGRPGDADDRTAHGKGVRLVEQFAARDVPRAALGDATAPVQPSEVRVDAPWTPGDGAEALHRRFAEFLDTQRYDGRAARQAVWGRATFPPLQPAASGDDAAQKRDDWQVFTRRVIDGPYAAIDRGSVRDVPDDREGARADTATQRFRAFLQRRYGSFSDVPDRWSRAAGGFGEVTLPRELPGGQRALEDWMHFAGAVLPIHRSAHRFRVLVPVDPDADMEAQKKRLALARRVVDTQKPAHTTFDVLPYWAAFRVGVARTGLDTVLGTGSRYAPLVVGDGAVGEETVGAAHPQNVTDRRVAGRDRAGSPRPL